MYKKNLNGKKMKGIKKGAFSLVEVLMSILIVSVLMVIIAPVITKRVLPPKAEGVVYTYRPDNRTTTSNVCFTTEMNYSTKAESFHQTLNCSEYTFKVPENVRSINLTLVAGGGGGGGAGGGVIQNHTVATGDSDTTLSIDSSSNFILDLLKKVKINFLTAKGESGNKYYTFPVSGTTGGDSSPAVVNFELPGDYMRGLNFTNSLSKTALISGVLSVSNTGNAASVGITSDIEGSGITYAVNSSREINCTLNTTTYGPADTGFAQKCKIPNENIIGAKPGAYPQYVTDSDYSSLTSSQTAYNETFHGGKGGKTSFLTSQYGSGGNGGAAQWATHPYSSSIGAMDAIDSEEGKRSHASVTYTIERPGGAGGAGAGGSVIKIQGFPVTPGDTYTIRVGKGGDGGVAGVSSLTSSNGSKGKGGTTTSIYKGNTLLFMVSGGAGGQGGFVWSSGDTGTFGVSGRNYPKIFSSADSYLSSVSNSSEMSLVTAKEATKPTNISYSRSLVYSYLQKEPYKTLNLNGLNADDNRTGGFSDFNNSTPTVYGGRYDGLYYRTLIKNGAGYIGGLGGFAGLSGKAGCGGYFMGNFDGRTDAAGTMPSDDSIKAQNLNTFTLSDGSYYDIFEYYDNCNIQTPNGQSANFVLPDPVSSSYGQAGAGGGGGGYSTNQGPGKGGDGQDGYLMIDWRR